MGEGDRLEQLVRSSEYIGDKRLKDCSSIQSSSSLPFPSPPSRLAGVCIVSLIAKAVHKTLNLVADQGLLRQLQLFAHSRSHFN